MFKKNTILAGLMMCVAVSAYAKFSGPFQGPGIRFHHLPDSAGDTPPNVTSMGHVVTSKSPSIKNERYDQIISCPENIHCPDAPNILPAGTSTPNCPSTCVKTRVLGAQSANGSFSGSTDAVCPVNYTQVASFNMQDEVAYIANPTPVTPIPISQWTDYLRNGFICSPSNSIQTNTICGMARRKPSEKFDVDVAGANLGINPDTPANIGGNAGTWLDNNDHTPSRSKECYTAPCLINVGDCGDGFGDEILTRKFYFPYALYQCRPPAGVYKTGRKAPISIVCVRRQAEWRPVRP